MQMLHDEKLARYDVAVRAWAAQDVNVAEGVKLVDERRFAYLKSLFHDIGIRGHDLDLRTRLFVVYHSTEMAMRLPPSGLGAEDEIRLRHAFFTR